MKRVIAKIEHLNISDRGKVLHFRLDESGGMDVLLRSVALNIVEEDDGFFLLRMDEAGRCISDTWHSSLEDAKRQAMFEFSINEADWEDCK
ncbi:hypothetical protein [Stenotrophomonas acidaminiphila]|uniref:hypothetical protein n=1 Tax=Stenotrophomonas acidaminiphila TaxID=128780 RepID=UPI00139247D3|nr:hypothetical protein [Stenotrophomonas acidaminiphila]WHL18686.1 hypothetical protein QLF99_16825 [Stenotrophomonas acidaminiphila]